MKNFKEVIGIDDFSIYFSSKPDIVTDFKLFARSLENRPSKTRSVYTSAVRVFFSDQDFLIPAKEINKLRRHGRLPKKTRASTRDKIPTKEQMRRILDHLDSKGRALTLFLASTGCRIGETLQLEVKDLSLDEDPPSANIRDSTTKDGEAGRIVYMSYEVRDAIKNWLRARVGLKKKNGESFESNLLFPFISITARTMWNQACDKAGLDVKDNYTNRRLYNLHSLRKFFRTNIGLEDNFVHALMGHLEYLDDAYLRARGVKSKIIYSSSFVCLSNLKLY